MCRFGDYACIKRPFGAFRYGRHSDSDGFGATAQRLTLTNAPGEFQQACSHDIINLFERVGVGTEIIVTR